MTVGTHLTRSELLASGRLYDKWRDGPDALALGTPIERVPYTGGTRIALDDTAMTFDRIVWFVRTHADELDTQLVDGINAQRDAQVPAHLYDWDCRFCERAVMTEDLADACPSCGLS